MMNAKKFKEVFGVNPDTEIMILECPLRMETCQWRYDNACHCEDWWAAEYQEPTTKNDLAVDCISRVDVLNNLASIAKVKAKSDAQKSLMGRCMFMVERMPPVTPQEPRKGHWIDSSNGWMCSECNRDNTFDTNYCPKCGAKMVEPQESEET